MSMNAEQAERIAKALETIAESLASLVPVFIDDVAETEAKMAAEHTYAKRLSGAHP